MRTGSRGGTPDTVFTCSTGDPRIADVLLREIQPGNFPRVTGLVVQPEELKPRPGSPLTLWRSRCRPLGIGPERWFQAWRVGIQRFRAVA